MTDTSSPDAGSELGLAFPPLAALASSADVAGNPLAPTPAIADADDPTPALTEGPYFTPKSPLRRSIVPAGGRRYAADTDRARADDERPDRCPSADRLLAGRRPGSTTTAATASAATSSRTRSGRYTLFTVVPGLYPGRTRHIHVKVQAPGEPVLTTQLFFPGVARTGRLDLRPRVPVWNWRKVRRPRLATFDFVLG